MAQFLVGAAVCPLTGAMAAGTTIVNNSGVSAVWVDSNPGIASGLGVRLGPKGSMSWTTAGAPAYAILDAGSTIPALLSLSSDVGSVDNPVDVGVSVALQLANQPLTLTTDTQSGIGSAVRAQPLDLTGTTHTGIANAINTAGVPNTMTGALVNYTNFSQTVDVSAYASVVLSGVSQPGVLAYYFYADAAGTKQIGSRQFVMAGAQAFNFSASVLGPYFKLVGPPVTNFVMYGTNRDHGDKFYGATPSAKAVITQAWTAAGTSVPFGPFFITNGGQHNARLVVTGGGKGFLCYSSIDQAGASFNAVSIHTGMSDTSPNPATPALSEVQRTIILPPGVLQLAWLSYTAATYQVIAEVTPIT